MLDPAIYEAALVKAKTAGRAAIISRAVVAVQQGLPVAEYVTDEWLHETLAPAAELIKACLILSGATLDQAGAAVMAFNDGCREELIAHAMAEAEAAAERTTH